MKTTYWNGSGRYQALADALQKLVPEQGPVQGAKNKKLERFRKASNAYYDIFNNGGCNLARSIASIFKFSIREFQDFRGHIHDWNKIHKIVEPVMDRIVLDAAAEQIALKA